MLRDIIFFDELVSEKKKKMAFFLILYDDCEDVV